MCTSMCTLHCSISVPDYSFRRLGWPKIGRWFAKVDRAQMKRPPSLSDSACNLPLPCLVKSKFTQYGSELDELSPSCCRFRTNFGRTWSTSVQHLSNLVNFGGFLTSFSQLCSHVALLRSTVAQILSIWDRVLLCSAHFFPDFDRFRPDFGHIWPGVGQAWSKSRRFCVAGLSRLCTALALERSLTSIVCVVCAQGSDLLCFRFRRRTRSSRRC